MDGIIAKGAKANAAIINNTLWCETCQLDMHGMGILVVIEHEDHELTTMEDIVRVVNRGGQDIIFDTFQWEQEGGYRGFVKSGWLSIRDIEKIVYGRMPTKEFEELEEWNG